MMSLRYGGIRLLCVVISLSLSTTSCAFTYGTKIKGDVVKALREDDITRTQPLVEIVAVPTADDSVLKIALGTRLHGPLYAVEVTEEDKKKISYNPFRTVGAAVMVAGTYGLGLLVWLQSSEKAKELAWAAGFKQEGSRRETIKSDPRKTDETGEMEVPWARGRARIHIGDLPPHDVIANDAGTIMVDLSEVLKSSGDVPTKPWKMTVTASAGGEQVVKTAEISLPALRRAYVKSIDMSPIDPRVPPSVIATFGLEENKRALTAGTTTELVVEVRNIGKGETSQLKATIESAYRLLNGRELQFGRVKPGSRRVWREPVTIPLHEDTKDVDLRIVFSEGHGWVPPDIRARVAVAGRGRPRFAYAVQIVDGASETSVGNQDGRVQRGEAIDLVVYLKNEGDERAERVEASIDLSNETPSHLRDGVRLKTRSQRLPALEPGQVLPLRFEVHVLPRYPGDQLALQLAVQEHAFGAGMTDRIQAAIDRPFEIRPIVIRQQVRVRAGTASLHSGVGRDTSVLAHLKQGGELLATGEIPDWYRVEWGVGRSAWVSKRDVEVAPKPPPSVTATVTAAPTVVEVFRQSPPTIAVVSPSRGYVTDSPNVRLSGAVTDVDGVDKVSVHVNSRQLPAADVDRGLRRHEHGNVEIDVAVPLVLGSNTIRVTATNRGGLSRQEVREITRVEPRAGFGKGPVLEAISDVDSWVLGRQPIAPNPRRWALVVGIEKYHRVSPVPFARRDANAMYEYAHRILGVPTENILLLIDDEATRSQLQVAIQDHLARRVQSGDQVFVFYAGHGMPDPATRQAYLLPADGDPQSIRLSGLSAHELYSSLGALKAERVAVFLDTCFSGIPGRDEDLKALLADARPGILAVADPVLAHANLVVLTAARHDQLANGLREQAHGLFTYHFLKGLAGAADSNRDGRIEIGELAKYVTETVDSAARRRFGESRQQTPTVAPTNLGPEREFVIVGR